MKNPTWTPSVQVGAGSWSIKNVLKAQGNAVFFEDASATDVTLVTFTKQPLSIFSLPPKTILSNSYTCSLWLRWYDY